jgi:guanosine-3',5'-bis(diphosphate) 3'-pyrophosphohydrolase
MTEEDIKAENKLILREYRALLKNTKREMDDADRLLIRKAFDLAVEAHRPMRRKSGEAYIFHPIAVARIVSEEIGLGTTSIVCALLHDVVEDTEINLDDIESLFGTRVRIIMDLPSCEVLNLARTYPYKQRTFGRCFSLFQMIYE